MARSDGFKLYLLASAAAMSMAMPAQAQDQAEQPAAEKDDAILVVGQRKALETAAQKKKNADTVVDSITATDIGAFPDKSVAEALQRVPGITVARSAYKDDVMHYSAEPSTVIIRGLLQSRSEFNGRDTFSATSGYGLSWSDVSPELMGAVDTYKNQTAEMIEGGIAGTVDLRTRLPFDQKGQVITGTVQGNWGDINKKIGPEVSLLYSNRWETPAGEIGLLANGAYSEVNTSSQGVTVPRMMPFAAGIFGPNETYIPSGFNLTRTDYERIRKGGSVALQWESPSRALKATAQYNRSEYANVSFEHNVLSYWAWVDPAVTNHSTVWTDPFLLGPPDAPGLGFNEAGGGTPFTFGPNGLFGRGVITGSRGDWGYGAIDWNTGNSYVAHSTDQYGVLSDGRPLIQPCINSWLSHANVPCRAAPPINVTTRYMDEKRSVEDLAFNLQWSPSDRFHARFDYQHVKARTKVADITFNMRVYANVDLDLTGKYPSMTLLPPSGYNYVGGANFLSDPGNYSPESVMDHITDSKGTLDAFRADAAYEIGNDWLDQLRFGVRYADRRQQHNWSLYNWASITSDWGVNPADSYFVDSGPTYNDDGTVRTIRFQGYEPGYYENRNFGQSILGGGLLNNNGLIFLSDHILSDRNAMVSRFSIGGQTDLGGTASSTWNAICDRPDEMENSCFTPGEVVDVSEKSKAAYAMLKFGGDNAFLFKNRAIRGNIGLRYVEIDVGSKGATNFAPEFTAADLNCQPLSPDVIANLGPNQYAISPQCLAVGSVDDIKFSSGDSLTSKAKATHRYFLPSLNLRMDLAKNWYMRFAASRAISKPDIGLLKNYMAIRRSFVSQDDIVRGNPNLILNAAGQPVAYRYGYTAQMGNPRLKPISADQFDLSFEYYSDKNGSFSTAFFYKKFHDYIQNGTFALPVTNQGVTRDIVVTAPVNGSGASIMGMEIAYQRYFNFLPAPFDGLGVQANYTYIKNKGVKNPNLVVDTTGEGSIARSALPGMINVGRLENLSDHSANFVLMYEKNNLGLRLAYNWRSKYLNSVNDCCLGFPVWNKSEGFLDASLRYAITKNFEFNLQGQNLLSTKSNMYVQVKGPTDANPNQKPFYLPGGTFEYDRRVQAGFRVKF